MEQRERCSRFPLTPDGSRVRAELAPGFILCTSKGAAPSAWKQLLSGMEHSRTQQKIKQGSQESIPDVPRRVLLLLATSSAFHMMFAQPRCRNDLSPGCSITETNWRSILEKEEWVM